MAISSRTHGSDSLTGGSQFQRPQRLHAPDAAQRPRRMPAHQRFGVAQPRGQERDQRGSQELPAATHALRTRPRRLARSTGVPRNRARKPASSRISRSGKEKDSSAGICRRILRQPAQE